LELSPLLLKSPGAILADQLVASMMQEIDIETDELVDCIESFGGLRVGVSGTERPVLGNGVDGFLNVGGTPCQLRQTVLPVVVPHGVGP
jgi:hypothetical protein